jgi:putative DNA methylase
LTDKKRSVEQSIPLDPISAQSAREKSIRHGHISTLHIWWARRPLAIYCITVFGAFVLAATAGGTACKAIGEFAIVHGDRA